MFEALKRKESTLHPKSIIFIDGENIVQRFQSMVAEGKNPKNDVTHQEDEILWHPQISKVTGCHIKRVGYYTTKSGENNAILELSNQISDIRFDHPVGFGTLNPHVFHKARRGQKTKSVDINIVTDLLRHTYNQSVEHIFLLSGDGDYIPTISECMRQGIHVSVGAFSSGLNPNLQSTVDEFFDLDGMFFDN